MHYFNQREKVLSFAQWRRYTEAWPRIYRALLSCDNATEVAMLPLNTAC